ncbi:MAG TPA: hypothetical protein VH061_05345 [Solirubrobacteraceae bacterium]|nr:hypothetical protein [Solirubrobacteraceae bacterium]
MSATMSRLRALPVVGPAAVIAGALALRLIAGVGFANYDTLYGLAWGGQLAQGETPAYGVAIAPTPHPLLEILGVILRPLSPHQEIEVVVALGFLALAGCGWMIFRLGEAWFGRAAGALAALVFLTRVPVISYGVRAYLDLPYLCFVLGALLIEVRRPRAGAPVLALLALAGLLRPEAWVFSGLYWLYLLGLMPAWVLALLPPGEPVRERGRAIRLTLLAAAGPLIWLGSDLLVTGNPLWSLTNTRHTASTLDRKTGVADVPKYIPKRIGEVLGAFALTGAAIGGVLSLVWLRGRALPGTLAGVAAVAIFAAFAIIGLPINTRYAFLAASFLCIFCGAGVFGWISLPAGQGRRRAWMALGLVVAVGLIATAPSQIRTARHELRKLAAQERIEGDLEKLVVSRTINLRCGPVGVSNHASVPLLALYLRTSPARIVSAEAGHIDRGVYVDPASIYVETEYILDSHDPHEKVTVPPGFTASGANRSWLIFHRCEG